MDCAVNGAPIWAAKRLPISHPPRSARSIVEGDVLDAGALRDAMQGQDVVYANLVGDMARQARAIIDAMHAVGLMRLIFVSSMGIYGEVPGETYRSVLDPYRDSAAEIEKSDLDYTILRPGWFTRDKTVSYRITQKAEPFKGHDVSLDGFVRPDHETRHRSGPLSSLQHRREQPVNAGSGDLSADPEGPGRRRNHRSKDNAKTRTR